MPLKIVIKDRLACPCVICDACGNEITDAEDGNCIWLEDDKTNVRSTDGVMHFTHKNCNDRYERKNAKDGMHWCSNDLDTHMVYLLNNIHWNQKRATEYAKALDMIG